MRRWIARFSHRVAHLDVLRRLDVRGEIARFADFKFLADVRLRIETADFFDLIRFAGLEQFDVHAGLEFAVENAHVRDHTFVGIEIGIETKPLHRNSAGRFRRGTRATIASRISSMPMPSLALARMAVFGRDRQNILELLFGLARRSRAANRFC